ncbi:S41 family peptidase [Bacillus testis]|uniref:S41 family peptidase n=1 Tax=Bacillus testis TaxID=1622072 RepID=UPI00067F4C20|nr:S41 family peptidase [Bacillus testis]
MNKKWVLPTAITLSLGAGAAGGMAIGPDIFMKWKTPTEDTERRPSVTMEEKETSEDLAKVGQAYDLIKNYYIEEKKDAELVSGAIQGMLASLKDPYSVYMDKATAKQFNDSLDSSFEGIGTEIGMEETKVVIVSPYKDSPAEKAGLKPKDEIVSVNGESVKGLNVQEVSVKIRGEKGTKVKLEIKRPGVSEPMMFSIKRDEIPIETVFSSVKEEAGKKVGYIEITSFSQDTGKAFRKQLKALESKKIKGLIVDVRGNPGGLLPAVREVLNELIPENKPLFRIEERNGNQEETYSKLENKKDYKIAVLIDNGSASASEILAAAMEEAGGYPLIGEKTFGKGTVQQAVEMDDGSNIKLTLYKWLTPDGNWIHKKGIKPTMEIKQPKIYHTQPLNVEKPLKQDMTNEQVQHAQVILKSLGYDPGRTDGYFDVKTETAVRAFQNGEHLKNTGTINLKTAQALEQTINKAKKDDENDMQLQAAIRYLLE